MSHPRRAPKRRSGRPTAVVLRCTERGHELLRITAAMAGTTRFVVTRAAGSAADDARDEDAWMRNGRGIDSETGRLQVVAPISREIDGRDAGNVEGLLGLSPYLFCRCGRGTLDPVTADAIGEALYRWFEAASRDATRPLAVFTSMK